MAQGLIAISFCLQQRCAKWRLDAHGTILAFAHHTDWWCQYRSLPKRIIHLFVGSWLCVSSFPRHDTSYTYRTLSHPHPQHMPPFTSPYQIARPLLVTSRQASFQHVRDGLSCTIFVLVLRVVVTCLLLGVSLSRCAWNAKEHVHNQQFVGALRHLRTLNTTRPQRSDRRNSPGPGRHKSTGHTTVEETVGVTNDFISPFLPLDLMMWHVTSFLVCATGKRLCPDPPVTPCLIHLVQGPRGFRLKLW